MGVRVLLMLLDVRFGSGVERNRMNGWVNKELLKISFNIYKKVLIILGFEKVVCLFFILK